MEFIEIINFFNSSFFTSFTTIIVGGFAIYLYLKQKTDHRRDAARLILQEIRYAEQQIRNFKEFGEYRLSDKLLPTNNWNKNIHLFIKDLKETEIDLISKFYSKASYIDIVISKISDQKHESVIDTSSKEPIFVSKVWPVSQKILKDISLGVEFIYNTPAIDKLRAISEKKWYQLF